MESDSLYYARRALQEETRAARALSEHAREWHAQLARQFKARLTEQPLDA
ncbi:hypothetical protein [Sphingosinicella rhizophila]|uniref:Uncharacterized protein n=1 Tax=Sphingosinicella rhizophila TaxID=3050082 RepID=A0ABU3Q9R5_9SPHN|nr:hypothetical protein [Sphingosinicella sp. GR2756]MDT9600127.1 hypothetical protein [Sphingosinicella sp. GR2756]